VEDGVPKKYPKKRPDPNAASACKPTGLYIQRDKRMKSNCNTKLFTRAVWAVLACVVLIACEQEVIEEQAPVVRPVKLLTVGSVTGGAIIEFPGTIAATQDAEIAFEVAGQVIELPVSEGDDVEKNAVLARLDDRDYAADRDKSLALRNAARADFNRYDEAYKADAVTAQDVDLARRNLDVAEANLRTKRKAVEDTVLRAPFAGRVAIKHVDEFETVQAKQAILLLQDESGLEIKVNIAERDWAQAEPGLSNEEITARVQPHVAISSFPDRQFPARIVSRASAADPVTRTYAVSLAFESPDDLNIKPGMTAKVIIAARKGAVISQGLLIPAIAVLADADNQPYVWVVEPDTNAVTRRSVQLGPLSGDSISVSGGLNNGDRVAISGVHSLVEGMPVRAMQE
jgi:RND family efflux transporter MFP subunit